MSDLQYTGKLFFASACSRPTPASAQSPAEAMFTWLVGPSFPSCPLLGGTSTCGTASYSNNPTQHAGSGEAPTHPTQIWGLGYRCLKPQYHSGFLVGQGDSALHATQYQEYGYRHRNLGVSEPSSWGLRMRSASNAHCLSTADRHCSTVLIDGTNNG